MTETANRLIILSEPSTGGEGDLRSIAVDSVRLLLERARSANTRRAYEGDLLDFFHALGEKGGVSGAAVELLLAMDTRRLVVTLQGYITQMRQRRLSDATINRRIAAVRMLLRIARQLGAANVADPKDLVMTARVKAYREVRGPDIGEAARLVNSIDRSSLKGKRDYAILMLLATNGLRRAEVLACDVADFDRQRSTLRIVGKGRSESQKETIELLPEVSEAIRDYLAARDGPKREAPLFASCDRRGKRQEGETRLSGRGLWDVISTYGHAVLGRHLTPHAFRHMATTEALEATGGNIPVVQDFTRHARPETVMMYRDRIRSGQGEVTRLLGERLESARNGFPVTAREKQPETP